MSPLIYGVLILAILGTLSGIGYKIHHSGYEEGKLECQQAADKQRAEEAQKSTAAATTLETQREKTKVVYRTITQNVDRVVSTVEYRDRACFDGPGVLLANAGLLRESPDPTQPDNAVPAANRALRRDSGDGAQKDR